MTTKYHTYCNVYNDNNVHTYIQVCVKYINNHIFYLSDYLESSIINIFQNSHALCNLEENIFQFYAF